jgi:acetyl-CoA acetyltransferase
MKNKVIIAGVGMTPFLSPKTRKSYIEFGKEALLAALKDAGIGYDKIQQAYVGWVYGDSTAGQAVIYEAGMTGIPVINVNNNCSTGSTALFLARQAVENGVVDCALALGFEQMTPGALESNYNDRPTPLDKHLALANNRFEGAEKVPLALRVFGAAGYEYQEKYGASTEIFAKVRAKASEHAVHNERAIFRKPISVEEVLASKQLFLNLTRLQCCPPTCGGAAAIICSEDFAKKHQLDTTVMISGQAMTTDTPSTFSENSMMKMVGYDMSKEAAKQVYEQAGIGAKEVDVVEMHDCFTTNEVITYEALDLCGEGEAAKFIMDKDNTYGGKVVTNPSGGLLSKGHPLGATGLAQCAELVWQLRGTAGQRQVENAKVALQHNIGLGGACVVTMYEKNG